jgi:hypothetical protein
MDDLDKAKLLYDMQLKGDTFYIITTSVVTDYCLVWRCVIRGKTMRWGRPIRYHAKPCEWSSSASIEIEEDNANSINIMNSVLHAGYDVREITAFALEMNRAKLGREWNWPRI